LLQEFAKTIHLDASPDPVWGAVNDVRRVASWLSIVREVRDVAGVPALVTSMGDGDDKIREEAIGALVEIYAESPRTTPMEGFLDMFSDEYDRSSIRLSRTSTLRSTAPSPRPSSRIVSVRLLCVPIFN